MTMEHSCPGLSGNDCEAALTQVRAGPDGLPRRADIFHGGRRTPHGETRPLAFRARNPVGELPLPMDGDRVLSPSGAIRLRTAGRALRLAGDTPAARRGGLRPLLLVNPGLSGMAGPLRFYPNVLPAARRAPAVDARLPGRLASALRLRDAGRDAGRDSRDRIATPGPRRAGPARCGDLFCPGPSGFGRRGPPHADRRRDRIAARPGWPHPHDPRQGSPADRR
jgi:glutathione S-transferase